MAILTQEEINDLMSFFLEPEPELLPYCCMDFLDWRFKEPAICSQCHKTLCVKDYKDIMGQFCKIEYACNTKNQTHQGWWAGVELCLCCANKNANKEC